MTEPTSRLTKRLQLTFRALDSRNYLLFFIGQGVSLIGTWIHFTAMGWLVYRLTNSALLLGLISFSGQFPAFLLAPFAGVFADRWNRRWILIITQFLAMLQALALGLLVLNNTITVWHLILLSLFMGFVTAFDMTTRQSFVIDMVERKEDLGNAIALNSSLFNGARLFGPSIAGLIIEKIGEGLCFLLNGVSFFAIIIALFAMKTNQVKSEKKTGQVMEGLKEGFSYAFSSRIIRNILLLIALLSVMGMPYGILMPVFAKEIFHGGAQTLGFLMSASGLGALFGAISLASKKTQSGLSMFIPVGSAIFGAGLIVFAISNILWLSLILIFITSFGMMIGITSCNTMLQFVVDEDKRGRIMSLYTMAFMGMMPFGSLIGGYLAHIIGGPKTLIIGGIFCILGGLAFYYDDYAEKKYDRKS